MHERDLQRYLEQLADRQPLDWEAATQELPPARLRALRHIDSIANAYRRVCATQSSERFARLILLERIGGGFGGEVWRARDPALDRDVALKLHDAGPIEARRRGRLLDEARTLAKIDHPNVLRVLGADVSDGRVGVWTEFVAGENLESRGARDGRIGAEEARSLGIALCGALAAVHRAGFVHGDLKPANVMRTRDGRYVLCDLGSAVALRGEVSAHALASGSPLFLAPEVLAGGRPGIASDIYALGATLFQLLAGAAPVGGASLPELLAAHREGRRRRLRDLRPDLPSGLVATIEQTLAASPAQRPASAGTLQSALAERPRPLRGAATIAATAVVAIAIALFVAGRRPPPLALSSDVRWFRNDAGAPLFDGATVQQGDTLRLELSCARPCWTYVLAEDGTHDVATLFPLPATRTNPQIERIPLQLPGIVDGADRRWRIGPAHGEEERMLLVVAESALAMLDSSAHPLARAEDIRHRGVDALVAAPLPASETGLDALAARLRDLSAPSTELHWLRLHRSDAGDTPASGAQTR